MDGTSPRGPGIQRVVFPGVVINLNAGQAGPPPTAGTVGSVVNHVGFVVQNVQESVAKWKAAGVPVLPGNNNRLDQAYVETADGLRIEILENKSQKYPIQQSRRAEPGMQDFWRQGQPAQQRSGRRRAWCAAFIRLPASTSRTAVALSAMPCSLSAWLIS
jgi:hypothetical protein